MAISGNNYISLKIKLIVKVDSLPHFVIIRLQLERLAHFSVNFIIFH